MNSLVIGNPHLKSDTFKSSNLETGFVFVMLVPRAFSWFNNTVKSSQFEICFQASDT